jgi:hypothetical protein
MISSFPLHCAPHTFQQGAQKHLAYRLLKNAQKQVELAKSRYSRERPKSRGVSREEGSRFSVHGFLDDFFYSLHLEPCTHPL